MYYFTEYEIKLDQGSHLNKHKVPEDMLFGGNKPWNDNNKRSHYRLQAAPSTSILLSIRKLSAWSLTCAVQRV